MIRRARDIPAGKLHRPGQEAPCARQTKIGEFSETDAPSRKKHNGSRRAIEILICKSAPTGKWQNPARDIAFQTTDRVRVDSDRLFPAQRSNCRMSWFEKKLGLSDFAASTYFPRFALTSGSRDD